VWSELRLKPGKHTLDLSVRRGNCVAYPSLWLVGEAGKTYQIHHDGKDCLYRV